MKVLIVNKFLYPNGGSETYIFKIGEYLSSHGHEVQFFGMEHKGRIVGNHAECYTDNMDFHTGKLSKLLYPFKIIYSREAKTKMLRVLEDFNPDVVHLNNFNFQLTPSIIYAVKKYEKKYKRKVQIVYTAHDSQWVCPNHLMRIPSTGALCMNCLSKGYDQCSKNRCIHNSKVKSILATFEAKYYKWKKTYRFIDTIICPSQFLNRNLSTYKLIADKCITLHNFVEQKEMKPIEKEDYILYFGRYSVEKGVETLLKVCKMLPDIPFVFAGSGELKEMVDQLENVKEVGFLSGEKLVNAIAKARFSLFTSECYENCPFSVMESQMYGTPVIAANIGGTPELIKDKGTGELYESGNASQLKEKIERLWSDRALLEKYTKQCSNIKFDSLDEYGEKLVRIYAGKGI